MLTWTCERVRAELSAFYDEELPVAERIAISDHLDGCPSCRARGETIWKRSAGRSRRPHDRGRGGHAGAEPPADRRPRAWDAEEKASLGRTIRDLFDDPRRASACVGVSVVASLCLAMGAFLLAQSPIRHPESLKAAMTLSARARTTDIYLPTGRMLPRAYAEAIMPAAVVNGDDEEVAFAALVTADGYLEELELIGERITRPAADCRRTSSCQSCSTPPRRRGSSRRVPPARPVSQNVVWLVSYTTVRAPLRAYVHVRVDGWKTLSLKRNQN